jgi:hypothetical protein
VFINLIGQFAWFPAFPLWSMVAIALDIFVLFALTVRWSEARSLLRMEVGHPFPPVDLNAPRPVETCARDRPRATTRERGVVVNKHEGVTDSDVCGDPLVTLDMTYKHETNVRVADNAHAPADQRTHRAAPAVDDRRRGDADPWSCGLQASAVEGHRGDSTQEQGPGT